MRLAAIADVHGNLAALDAVLDDIARQSPDLTVNLGDCLSGPLQARETAELLRGRGFPTVRGNHDRHLVHTSVQEMGPSDSAAHAALGDGHLAWLRTLPASARPVEGVYMCHGSPVSDDDYLIDTIVSGRLALASRETITRALGGIDAALVLCGHSHTPRAVQFGDRLVVNPGSVGLPAYATDLPERHTSETGSPHARYAVLDRTPRGWECTFRLVEYDWHAAADLARRNGRSDWESALRTGFAPINP